MRDEKLTLLNLKGKIIGKVTVIDVTRGTKGGTRLWKCACWCGNVANISGIVLVKDQWHTSCGCMLPFARRNLGKEDQEQLQRLCDLPDLKQDCL